MKNLNSFIIERLKLNKDSKLRTYNYYPKDFDELRSLLENLLADEERGKDADLNDIDVSNVTTFYDKYEGVGLFEYLDPHNIKIDQWNVSKCEIMDYMFYECHNFNSDLSNWNVSQVKSMRYMFYECYNFNLDLSKWNVSQVKNMRSMFWSCKKFNLDLSKWNVSNVEDMEYMFFNCENFNSDLSKWDVSNVENMDNMFLHCEKLKNKPSWYK